MPLIDLAGLGHFKDKENEMIAADYSATKTYAVGNYAYYNGVLYKCTTAITTAEAWTSGHWTAAKIADDIASQTEANTVPTFQAASNWYELWEQGSIWNNTGANTTTDRTDRLRTKEYIIGSGVISVSLAPNYKLCIFAYESTGTYVGILQSDGTYKKTSTAYYYFSTFPSSLINSQYIYRFVLAENNDANLGIKDSSNVVLVINKDIVSEDTTTTTADCLSVFCSEMNNKAAQLGMTNSSFDNPSGRYNTNLSTARDLVKLGIACSANETLNHIWGKKSYTVNTKDVLHRTVNLTTTVQDNDRLDKYYHVFGGKTGAIDPMFTLLEVCEVNGKKVVGAIGGATDADARFSAMKQLMDIVKNSLVLPYKTIPFTKLGNTNYIIWETGLGSTNISRFFYTDFIDISSYSRLQYKNYLATSAEPAGGMAFYSSADKTTYISGIPAVGGQADYGYTDFVDLPIPEGANYIRVSGLNDTATYGNLEIRGVPKTSATVTDATYACAAILPENPSMYDKYAFQYLYEQAADAEFTPCSITKCLSALVILEHCGNINDVITVIKTDEIGGTGAVFNQLDQISYKDALFAMMLPSSNVAAQAAARCIGYKMLNEYKLGYLLS